MSTLYMLLNVLRKLIIIRIMLFNMTLKYTYFPRNELQLVS